VSTRPTLAQRTKLETELAALQEDYVAARLYAEDRREARNAAVQRALRAGLTHAVIATALGVERARIAQLSKRKRRSNGQTARNNRGV
jgi:hypothetical protein